LHFTSMTLESIMRFVTNSKDPCKRIAEMSFSLQYPFIFQSLLATIGLVIIIRKRIIRLFPPIDVDSKAANKNKENTWLKNTKRAVYGIVDMMHGRVANICIGLRLIDDKETGA